MTNYSADRVVWTTRVQDAFGPVVELQDEDGGVIYYAVEKEFDIDGSSYVVLKPENSSDELETEIFKLLVTPDGSLELLTIDDDEEWEDISELYDELTFPE